MITSLGPSPIGKCLYQYCNNYRNHEQLYSCTAFSMFSANSYSGPYSGISGEHTTKLHQRRAIITCAVEFMHPPEASRALQSVRDEHSILQHCSTGSLPESLYPCLGPHAPIGISGRACISTNSMCMCSLQCQLGAELWISANIMFIPDDTSPRRS